MPPLSPTHDEDDCTQDQASFWDALIIIALSSAVLWAGLCWLALTVLS